MAQSAVGLVRTGQATIGQAVVRRAGTTATLFAYGPMVKVAMDAAEAAQEAQETRARETG